MKTTFLGLLLISLFFQAKSQVIDTLPWCPPGATWVYRSFSPTSRKYFQFTYTKDTLLSNLKVKKWNVEAIQIIGPNRTEFARTSETVGAEFLYNSNDSIYWFDKINNDFKFIYSFNPQLNDKFIVGNSRAKCYADSTFLKNDTIKVTQIYKDTFSNIIFDAYNTDSNRKYKLGSIVKNIGSTSSAFPQINGKYCNNSNAEYGIFYEGLICYSDSLRGTISFSPSVDNECHLAKTTVQNITKKESPLKSKIYPNPAHNLILIENFRNTKFSAISIYRASGQLVFNQNYFSEKLDVSSLANGLYWVKIDYRSEGTQALKLVKE